MRRTIVGLLLAVTLLSGSGCASIVASGFGGDPYGGVSWDARTLGGRGGVGEKGFALVDLGPSLVLDTVLLPRTLFPGNSLRSSW